jgi:hypothetical protein
MKGDTAKMLLIYLGLGFLLYYLYTADMFAVVDRNVMNYEFYAIDVDSFGMVTFVPDYKIGAWEFHSSPLSFVCNINGDADMPEPSPECWQTKVTFNNNDYVFTYNTPVQIGPYISSYFVGDGHVEEGIIESQKDYKLTYYFDIDTVGFSSEILYKNKEILFNSTTQLPIKVTNNLAEDLLFGVQIKYTPLLFYTEDIIIEKFFTAPLGDSKFYVEMPTNYLGNLEVESYPFIIIDGNRLFDTTCDSTILVISKTASPTENICLSNDDCPIGSVCTFEGCKEIQNVTLDTVTSGDDCPTAICYDINDECKVKFGCDCIGEIEKDFTLTYDSCVEIVNQKTHSKTILIVVGVVVLVLFVLSRKRE